MSGKVIKIILHLMRMISTLFKWGISGDNGESLKQHKGIAFLQKTAKCFKIIFTTVL